MIGIIVMLCIMHYYTCHRLLSLFRLLHYISLHSWLFQLLHYISLHL